MRPDLRAALRERDRDRRDVGVDQAAVRGSVARTIAEPVDTDLEAVAVPDIPFLPLIDMGLVFDDNPE